MTHRDTPPVAPAPRALRLGLALATIVALPTATAHAQQPVGRPDAATIAVGTSAPAPREELLGYDPASDTLAYVERAPSGLAGFAHVTLVEVTRDAAPRRTRLTTDVDATQLRAAPAGRAAVDARVARDVAAARARYQPGAVFPVSEPGARAGACTRPPFAAREFRLATGASGDAAWTVRAAPAADGASTQVTLAQGGRAGAATDVPAVVLTSAAGPRTFAPYDRVADARELPGTDRVALLLRSDACTPEGSPVPARAVFVAPPPPPERPLVALPHAEVDEAAVMRLLAPRARRRTVDEVTGYFEGRVRVVFDNAWSLPGGELVLVQYARHEADMPTTVTEAGLAYARFALLAPRPNGRGLRVVAMHAPPAGEAVYEGTGQEAFGADLDGDGRVEAVVRARYLPDGEVASVLRIADESLQLGWHTVTRADERATPPGPFAEVRRCTLGVDGAVLVNRCTLDRYRAGAPRDAAPTGRTRLVQRARWTAGTVQVTEERR